jgi:hypothetical protein
LAVPWQAEPESSVVRLPLVQADGADVLCGRLFQSQRPVPFVAALDSGKRDVTIEGERSIGGIWPWNVGVQEPNDVPLGKDTLRLRRIGELQRPQQKPLGL